MAIIIDYPQASLKNALDVAKAVDELGGRCTTEMAAEKLGMKMSGGYRSLVGAAAKYGLVTSKSGTLETTAAFKDYKLAYSPEAAWTFLQQCLLKPPVFQKVYERFKGRALPLGHFDKLLIKEFGVAEATGSRVAKYFVDGAKMCSLLGQGNVLIEQTLSPGSSQPEAVETDAAEADQLSTSNRSGSELPATDLQRQPTSYTVRISGPGMDSVVAIHESDDLDIVDIMLKKVRRQLSSTKAIDA